MKNNFKTEINNDLLENVQFFENDITHETINSFVYEALERWSEIKTEIIKIKHMAIINEDVLLLENVNDSWWEWIVSLWEKFKEWVYTIFERMRQGIIYFIRTFDSFFTDYDILAELTMAENIKYESKVMLSESAFSRKMAVHLQDMVNAMKNGIMNNLFEKNISTRQDILSNIKNISQESTMLRLINDLNSNFKNLQLEFMVQKNIINDRKRRLTTMETRSFVIVPKGIFQDMFDFYRILTNFNDKLMDSIEFKINEDIDNVLYSIRTFHSDLSDQIKGKIDNPSNKPSNYNEQVFKNVERTLEKYSSDYIRLLRDMLNTAIIIRNTGQQVIKSNYVVCREVLILSKAKSYLK